MVKPINFNVHLKQIKRQIKELFSTPMGLLIILILTSELTNAAFHAYSLYDRAAIRRDEQIIQATAEKNRKMLDARARIQITIIETAKRRGAFTPEEIERVSKDWDNAEYNEVEENPLR